MANTKRFNPLISVIMPVYNREDYLNDAIDSVLHQTYTNFELILADDGSTDGSGEIIRQYAHQDKRIRSVYFPHKGLPGTLNAVIPMTRGPFIAFMDSDDVALPHRFRVQMDWMEEKRLDLCGVQVESFGSELDLLDVQNSITRLPTSHEVIAREMLFQVPLWRSALMLKAKVAQKNPFNKTMDCTDCEWPYRVVQRCLTGNVPQVLLRARRHGQNLTTIRNAGHRIDATKSHFQYFYSLYPRTPLPDYIALCRVIDQVPMTSLDELARAGRWLVELARYPDEGLQKRMDRRWQSTCKRSNGLTGGVSEIYRRFQTQLENMGRKFK